MHPQRQISPVPLPLVKKYGCAQAVKNKFPKVRLLPQMSFYTAKIIFN